jgi:hypothetical protein
MSEDAVNNPDERLADSSEPGEVEAEELDGNITEPFDPSQINIKLWQPTIELIMKRIKEDEIDLMPDFQRNAGLWKNGPKSRLIESLLVKIPLPAFYLDSTDEARLVVVDGLQRLTALKEFMVTKELRLEKLEFLGKELDGKTFDELPRAYKRRIEETQVTVFQIEKGTPEEVKFNIFKRINTGGLPLSSQEIRHALNGGPGRNFLKELAASDEFRLATAGGVKDDRMADREMILRFLAFLIYRTEAYAASDFDLFLSRSFARINNMSELERANLGRRTRRMLIAAHAIFGNRAFRKWYKEGENRNPVNKALFESWAVNLDSRSDEELALLAERSGMVHESFWHVMAQRDFDFAVSQGTGDPGKVKVRFSRVRAVIDAVLAGKPYDAAKETS